MRAKEYLQKLKKLDTVIDQKIKEIDNLKLMSTSVGALDYSRDKVQTSPDINAPYVRSIDRICDMQNEISMEIDRFIDEKHKIINQIQGLSDSRYIEVLFKRYVEYKKFETIATEMCLTYTYVIEIHGYALQQFEKNI